ncbi:DUF1643 domain-containing protein [Saccharicrinis sp. FJH54]|uniref:DUF1643 domain-containing protein n=1 Tax=Saccharicrinis sp. FJH54 TaxID=3344665 RepID=UPI0035D4E178
MRENFKITGLFYQKNGYNFRKFLNIARINSDQVIPDLIVVMMNPGSSRPLNGNENNNNETEAIPDNTQDQIMRVMNNCNFDFARILNLSDLREPKSSIFYKKIEELKRHKISHSIFDLERNHDYEKYFMKNVPVIFAWGVNENLFELAKLTVNQIGKITPIGLKKKGFEYAYYHPLPQNYTKQKEWVNKISEVIKKAQNNV